METIVIELCVLCEVRAFGVKRLVCDITVGGQTPETAACADDCKDNGPRFGRRFGGGGIIYCYCVVQTLCNV